MVAGRCPETGSVGRVPLSQVCNYPNSSSDNRATRCSTGRVAERDQINAEKK